MTTRKYDTNEFDPATLQVLREFEGFYLAKKPDGNFGIFRNHTEKYDWEAMRTAYPTDEEFINGDFIYLEEPYEVAYQFDDDCNHLLQKEWYGLFEHRVINIKMELASY